MGQIKKVAIITLGCRVNQSESSVIEGSLRQHGASIVDVAEDPDYCIVNTCTVTARSDTNSRQLIRRAARTGARVIVTGCYSELSRSEAERIPGVCKVVPVNEKDSIISHIIGRDAEPVYNLHGHARPYLKVQDGCNFRCSYCAVPLARGRSRSLPLDEAVRRASEIVRGGYNEIVLTGIHLGSYGQDLARKTNLSQLIKQILVTTTIPRIRLSSIEINEIDSELMELISDRRVCKHLHLPLQSGSNNILKQMNRNYSVRTFLGKIMRIARLIENISFGTDVIIGFPSETDDDFKATVDVLNEAPFSYLHLFPYSERAGTIAADMKLKLSGRIISDRMEVLRELNRAKRAAYASAQLGKTIDVIAEVDSGSLHTIGTSSNYLKIRMGTNCVKRGSMVFVRLVNADPEFLDGRVIT